MKLNFISLLSFAILLCFTSIKVYGDGQISVKRNLNWNDSSYYYFADGTEKHEALYFLGATYNLENENKLPIWGESFKVEFEGNVSIEIKNPVYEKLKRPELVKSRVIDEELNLEYSFSQSRGEHFIDIFFIPIRRNSLNGNYEKLVSFELNILISPQANSGSRADDAHVYIPNSLLSNGTWYKIGITKNGIYKIDKTFIDKLGISTSDFNVETFGIFGYGSGILPEANEAYNYDDLLENSMEPFGLDDGTFNDGDYILFYAEGAHKWNYNSENIYTHTNHIYSDTMYYFISPDQGTNKLIQTQLSSPEVSSYQTNAYDALVVWDEDEVNLLNSGRQWFFKPLDAYTNEQLFSGSIPNILISEEVKMHAILAAKSSSVAPKITLSGNGLNVTTYFDITPVSTEAYFTSIKAVENNFFPLSSDFNINANFVGTSSDFGWIDDIEIHARAKLKYENGNQLAFQDARGIASGAVTKYRIDGPPDDDFKIWDITNQVKVLKQAFYYIDDSCEFTIQTDSLKKFVAFFPTDAFSSSAISYSKKIENQNLHDITKTPEYIIITPKIFESEARRFATWHHDVHGYDTMVVLVDHIYNEFSSGTQDLTALRNFLRMFYDRSGGDVSLMPKYVLLFGDGTFDYKNTVYSVDENTNFVPTFESYESNLQVRTYPTDDYIVCLDNGEGGDMSLISNKLDIAIGRFPVGDLEEAQNVVNKIMHYKSEETLGNWRNTICFIADDEDSNTHIDDADDIATYIDSNYPLYNLNKIYLDAYQQVPGAGGERYPDVNTALSDQIYSGALIINWAGHGNEQNWAQERILSVDDINGWTNFDKLPLFITATCSFSRFDNPERTSAGELILLNGVGGGVGLVSTVRIVYSYANYLLNYNFNTKIFNSIDSEYPTIGEAMRLGKNAVVSSESGTNTRKFFLFGDPGLQLNYPKYQVVTTTVNEVPVLVSADTLKALSKVTIKGKITDDSGLLLSDYNGIVYPTVFDKPINVNTLINDPEGSYPYTFKLQKSAIYNGKASVTNGEFSFTFVVPKDISYAYGFGKISYYASNGLEDGTGYEKNVIIGGTTDSISTDNIAPEIQVYMNDETFVFGGLTDENPFLYVVLQDENGMNTVGTGIGHDITATLDEDQQEAFKLNGYYESELDNYQKGIVQYPLRDLATGRHSILVKGWDVYNNSGEGYTEFVVAESAEIALDHVINYPNPFTTNTNFWFEHNRPGDILDVKIEIFTVSGKLVKTIQQQEITNGYRVSDIAWDGLDQYGDVIAKGVYVYKLTVKAQSDQSKANEFEKLVILR